jgi:hypothetical protein
MAPRRLLLVIMSRQIFDSLAGTAAGWLAGAVAA